MYFCEGIKSFGTHNVVGQHILLLARRIILLYPGVSGVLVPKLVAAAAWPSVCGCMVVVLWLLLIYTRWLVASRSWVLLYLYLLGIPTCNLCWNARPVNLPNGSSCFICI